MAHGAFLHVPSRRRLLATTSLTLVLTLAAGTTGAVALAQQERGLEAARQRQLLEERVSWQAITARVDQHFLAVRADVVHRAAAEAVVTAGVEAALAEVARAQDVLTASEGRVADDAVRVALAGAVDAAVQSQETDRRGLITGVDTLVAARAAVEEAVAAWEAAAREVAAWEVAEAERARAAEAAAAVELVGATDATRQDAPAQPAVSLADQAQGALAQLPGSGGVSLVFDDPQLGGHLAAVDLNDGSQILLNADRLAENPGQVTDVLRHEIAHVYQARIARSVGLATLTSRLDEIFGPGGVEAAADCVAISFGATWTWYTSDCAGPDKQAAVAALVAEQMP